ncbi:hypothetical protein PHMEG_0005689 [Phytophthora megakarya]|uniref:Uncharacterized protein n=1 Tax=Phytophthora megakarya TaxID=4795 RepID=A0A225WSL8_9STRA|nr:hypothetical protein PHMEG_0005689 [Phytophthora megakarya]
MKNQYRVCFMLQLEHSPDRYRVIKLTIMMVFAVDFGYAPIHHFLSSHDPYDISA